MEAKDQFSCLLHRAEPGKGNKVSHLTQPVHNSQPLKDCLDMVDIVLLGSRVDKHVIQLIEDMFF